MKKTNVLNIVSKLLELKKCSFLSLVYTNKQNETSRYTLQSNVNLMNVYKDDYETLSKYVCQNELELLCKDELLTTIKKSIDTEFNNENYTKLNYYTKLSDSIYFHENNLYFRNVFLMSKVVLIESDEVKKVVNSSEKTRTKRRLEKMLRRSKIREFCIDMSQIHKIKMNKETICIF